MPSWDPGRSGGALCEGVEDADAVLAAVLRPVIAAAVIIPFF